MRTKWKEFMTQIYTEDEPDDEQEFRMFPMYAKSGEGVTGHLHAAVEVQGWRRQMEDSTIIDVIENDDGSRDNLYGVFDGHGGAEVSLFCQCVLPSVLRFNLKLEEQIENREEPLVTSKETRVKRALKKTLSNMDDIILSEEGRLILMFIIKMRKVPDLFDKYFIWNQDNLNKLLGQLQGLDHEFYNLNQENIHRLRKTGCTANIVYLDSTSGKAFVANLGDSRCMFCEYDKKTRRAHVQPLSIDHKPEDPLENQRIQNSGWQVVSSRGCARIVRVKSLDPLVTEGGINISRTIGDW